MDIYICRERRENLGINNEMSDYFFRLIKNMPDYKEYISNYNIGSVLAIVILIIIIALFVDT